MARAQPASHKHLRALPTRACRAHPEPASALAFSAAALFTACHGTSARAWARPPLTPAAVVQRIDSLQSMDRAASLDR